MTGTPSAACSATSGATGGLPRSCGRRRLRSASALHGGSRARGNRGRRRRTRSLAIVNRAAVALRCARVLRAPAPVAPIVGPGGNAIELKLSLGIGDPENGTQHVRSEAFVQVLGELNSHGFEIPFPERDVRLLQCWIGTRTPVLRFHAASEAACGAGGFA
jgi:hypothetical protein